MLLPFHDTSYADTPSRLQESSAPFSAEATSMSSEEVEEQKIPDDAASVTQVGLHEFAADTRKHQVPGKA